MANPTFIGFSQSIGAEAGALVVPKSEPTEKVRNRGYSFLCLRLFRPFLTIVLSHLDYIVCPFLQGRRAVPRQ